MLTPENNPNLATNGEEPLVTLPNGIEVRAEIAEFIESVAYRRPGVSQGDAAAYEAVMDANVGGGSEARVEFDNRQIAYGKLLLRKSMQNTTLLLEGENGKK